jgi:hypothetical protein
MGRAGSSKLADIRVLPLECRTGTAPGVQLLKMSLNLSQALADFLQIDGTLGVMTAISTVMTRMGNAAAGYHFAGTEIVVMPKIACESISRYKKANSKYIGGVPQPKILG